MQDAFSPPSRHRRGRPDRPGLDATIDAVYDDIVEDSQGVTFIVDSNITANNPIPDAPPITQTLNPTPADRRCSAHHPVDGDAVRPRVLPHRRVREPRDGGLHAPGPVQPVRDAGPVRDEQRLADDGLVSALLGDPSYNTACPSCSVTLVLKPSAAAVARGPLGGETGTVILTVPNYHLDAVADQSGVPLALISANVTFNLPVTLNVSGAQIAPSVGAIDLTDVRVTDDPIGADATKFATGVTTLFPLAAQALGGASSAPFRCRLSRMNRPCVSAQVGVGAFASV
jgi:hypothetical protein